MSATSSFQSLSLLPRQVVTHYPRATAHVTSVLCTCGLLWLANVVINAVDRYRQLPKGPWGIPFIGYIPFMKKDKPTYIRFTELAKKYGTVFRFKLGGKHIVVINDWVNLYEAFHSPSFLGRPEQTMIPGIIDHLSFLEMSDQDWKQQRYRSMTILEQVIDSQERLEDRFKAEIYRFIGLIRQYIGAVDFGPKITKSLSNNITILLFGRIYDYEDPVKKELDEQIEIIFSEHRFAEIFACAPWLAKMYLACGRTNMDHVAEAVAFADKFFQRELDRHLRSINLAIPEPRDYIDGYLKEMATRETARLPEGQFNMEVMKRNAFGFYCAAVEKLTSSMLWLMYYLISYPEMQERIRAEIERVIGFCRQPTLNDGENMPYTNAFLNEVHRMGSVVAVNWMRQAKYDVILGGHLIPKNTYVLFNLWSIHRDPELFTDPDTFNPDRFLSRDGTELIMPPFLIPFSGGKRSCPGDVLSNMQLFLYLVCLLQKFRIKVAPECEITAEVDFRITRRPARLPPLVFENLVN